MSAATMMLERQISKSVSEEVMAMAFVNEYVSESDIKKYKLDEIWLKYHPEKKVIPKYVQLHWTADHERDSFLMCVGIGREEESNRETFVFYWKGETFEVKTDRLPGGSKKLMERPYRIILGLVGIWPSQPKTATRDQVLAVIKEALTVRGYDGARRQIPDTVVEFKNF